MNDPGTMKTDVQAREVVNPSILSVRKTNEIVIKLLNALAKNFDLVDKLIIYI